MWRRWWDTWPLSCQWKTFIVCFAVSFFYTSKKTIWFRLLTIITVNVSPSSPDQVVVFTKTSFVRCFMAKKGHCGLPINQLNRTTTFYLEMPFRFDKTLSCTTPLSKTVSIDSFSHFFTKPNSNVILLTIIDKFVPMNSHANHYITNNMAYKLHKPHNKYELTICSHVGRQNACTSNRCEYEISLITNINHFWPLSLPPLATSSVPPVPASILNNIAHLEWL